MRKLDRTGVAPVAQQLENSETYQKKALLEAASAAQVRSKDDYHEHHASYPKRMGSHSSQGVKGGGAAGAGMPDGASAKAAQRRRLLGVCRQCRARQLTALP